jgi:hypothetical protein
LSSLKGTSQQLFAKPSKPAAVPALKPPAMKPAGPHHQQQQQQYAKQAGPPYPKTTPPPDQPRGSAAGEGPPLPETASASPPKPRRGRPPKNRHPMAMAVAYPKQTTHRDPVPITPRTTTTDLAPPLCPPQHPVLQLASVAADAGAAGTTPAAEGVRTAGAVGAGLGVGAAGGAGAEKSVGAAAGAVYAGQQPQQQPHTVTGSDSTQPPDQQGGRQIGQAPHQGTSSVAAQQPFQAAVRNKPGLVQQVVVALLCVCV